MFTTIGIGIATIFRSVKGDSGGGPPFAYTAIDNSFSMEFDGATSYVDAGSSVGIIGTDVRTFSVWLKTSQTSGTQTVLGTRNINTDGWVIQISLNSIMFYNVKSPSNRISSTTNLTDGNWHNLIIVRAGSGNNKIYVDGVSQTLDNDSENLTDPQSSKNMLLGAGYNTGGVLYRFFDGKLDEVAIWSTALSESTIQAIYNTTANNPGKVADLSETPEGLPSAWYRMGD